MSEQLALFLGAGASRFLGMPTTKELMDEIREWASGRRERRYGNITSKKFSHLLIERIVWDEVYTDVEKLYDGIEDVIRVAENPNCDPFEMAATSKDDGCLLEEFVTELKEIRTRIKEILLDKFAINSNNHNKPIVQMYDKLQNILSKSGMKEFRIFTTNYDMVIETLAYKRKFELVNGFREDGHHRSVWGAGTDDSWRPQSTKTPLYLTKLHGSVNWHRDDMNRIIQIGDKGNVERSIMIYPTEGKKDYTGDPFYVLLERFEKDLENVKTLIVIGFSFRDDDLMKIIRSRIIRGMKLIVLSPSATEDIKRGGPEVKITDQPIKPHIKQGVTSEVLYTAGKDVILCNCKFSLDDDKWETTLGEALRL